MSPQTQTLLLNRCVDALTKIDSCLSLVREELQDTPEGLWSDDLIFLHAELGKLQKTLQRIISRL